MKRYYPLFFSLLISSCTNLSTTGTIYFVLDEGASFVDPNFSTSFIKGESNSIIINGLPEAKKEGYYFVGWREKVNNSYQFLQTRLVTDSSSPFYGKEVYIYPLGSATVYSYFEPLENLIFDLNLPSEYNPKIVPPVNGKDDFNEETLTLSGYEKKEFSSASFLPTAICENKTFSYWSIDYPLFEEIDNDTKRTFFVIDYSAEKGVYNFLDFFKTAQSFSFPRIPGDNKSLVLKAIWTDNTSVNLHLGLDNLTTTFFAQNRNIHDDIISSIEDNLGAVFFNSNGEIFIRNQEYKLIGVYLDDKYKYEFPISSNIGETSLDLYLLWGKKINVTLDYNGGENNSLSSFTFSSYGHCLFPKELASIYPEKKDAFFNYYSYNNERIFLSSFILPNEDITLVANYSLYPTLFLSYSFPKNYSYNENEFKEISLTLAPGSDISSSLSSFKNKVLSLPAYTNKEIEGDSLYSLLNEEENVFSSTVMPGKSLYVYYKISYSSKIILTTIANNTVYETKDIGYLYSKDINVPVASLYNSLYDDIVINNITYVYDYLYFDSSLSNKNTNEIISGKSSQEEIPQINVYRKISKGIKLTFTGLYSGSCYVLPSSSLESNSSKIATALGISGISNLRFYVRENNTSYLIGSILPNTDTTIYIE